MGQQYHESCDPFDVGDSCLSRGPTTRYLDSDGVQTPHRVRVETPTEIESGFYSDPVTVGFFLLGRFSPGERSRSPLYKETCMPKRIPFSSETGRGFSFRVEKQTKAGLRMDRIFEGPRVFPLARRGKRGSPRGEDVSRPIQSGSSCVNPTSS